MAKTEKEAAEIGCLQAINDRNNGGNPHYKCVGSRCMAWDWLEGPHELKTFAVDLAPPSADGWIEPEPEDCPPGLREGYKYWKRYRADDRFGDCGLKASMGPELGCAYP